MKTYPLALLGVGVALLAGCATGPKISSAYIQGSDYSHYRTFAVLPRVGLSGGVDAEPALASRIRAAAAEELSAKGFRAVAPAEAEFLVMIQGRITPRVNLADYGYLRLPGRPWRYEGDFGPGLDSPMWTTEVTVTNGGRLAVDLIDARTRELVWRGVARRERIGDQPDPERLAAVVRLILRRFPPQPD